MHAPSDVEVAERQARATEVYALELAAARRRFNEVFRKMNRFEMRRGDIDIYGLVQPTIEAAPPGYAEIEARDLSQEEVLAALGKTVPTERGAGRIEPLPPTPTAEDTTKLMAGFWRNINWISIDESCANWEGHEIALTGEQLRTILGVLAGAVADKLERETERIFEKVREKGETVAVRQDGGGPV